MTYGRARRGIGGSVAGQCAHDRGTSARPDSRIQRDAQRGHRPGHGPAAGTSQGAPRTRAACRARPAVAAAPVGVPCGSSSTLTGVPGGLRPASSACGIPDIWGHELANRRDSDNDLAGRRLTSNRDAQRAAPLGKTLTMLSLSLLPTVYRYGCRVGELGGPAVGHAAHRGNGR